MKLPLQITFRGMQPSDAIETAVRDKADKLDRFCADIMSCRVTIELLEKHHQHGRAMSVGIVLTLPGHELSVSRVKDEDLYVALKESFDDMRRQLEDTVRKRRDAGKSHASARRAQPRDDAAADTKVD